MSYSVRRSETEVYGYFTPKSECTFDADGDIVTIGNEYPLTYESYSEIEGVHTYYSDQTFTFEGPDGERDFQSENEALEWLKANGFTNDY